MIILNFRNHIKMAAWIKVQIKVPPNYKKMDINDSLEFALNTSNRAKEMNVPVESTQVSKYASLNFGSFNFW